jgi:hypothetical protein
MGTAYKTAHDGPFFRKCYVSLHSGSFAGPICARQREGFPAPGAGRSACTGRWLALGRCNGLLRDPRLRSRPRVLAQSHHVLERGRMIRLVVVDFEAADDL